MRIVYVGPHRAVTVNGIRQPVEKNVPVDVADELAASLLEQDIWQAAPTAPAKKAPAKKAPAKKAPAKKADPAPDPTATGPPEPEEITP